MFKGVSVDGLYVTAVS